jgi:dTDP-4-dehydrorhamnose reductase
MSSRRPILILGAMGQVGRELVARQYLDDRRIIGIPRAEVDVRSRDQLRDLVSDRDPAIVINAAAFTAVDRAESAREEALAINRDGSANVAAVCNAAGIPLLHISTDYVFDGCNAAPYRESDPVCPIGAYGASKLAGERAIQRESERYVILRTAWIFSAHGTNFLKAILRLARERPVLRVVDDQTGCPTPASAIADALLKISQQLNRGNTSWGVYHYTGAPAITWYGFARAIVAAASDCLRQVPRIEPIATSEYPTPARRPANSVLDCTKAALTFGLVPPDWRVGLGELVTKTMISLDRGV